MKKLTAATRARLEATGWHVAILTQPARLFPNDGRRHKNVAIPSDPWWAYLTSECFPNYGRVCQGYGPTADAAVLAAIPPDLRGAMRRLEIAVDNLRDCLQK